MESELADRVKSHDVDALAEYLSQVRRPLMVFVERRLGQALRGKLEPDDIVQEVSGEAIRSLRSVEFGDRNPFSWLCQIAERKIIDAHRRFFAAKKRDAGREVAMGAARGDGEDSPRLIDMIVASMTTASQAFSRNAKAARLEEALRQLPEEQREAIRMRHVENLSSREIAERLGKSDVAIRVMLSRTVRKLQEILGIEDR
jgi:RNA polymerase sigma-70 factor (ECF subfamily)